MLNIEYYKNEILKNYESFLNSPSYTPNGSSVGGALFSVYRRECKEKSVNIVEWLTQEYVGPILTDEAIAYLRSVVSPYSFDDVITITKNQDFWAKRYNVEIKMTDAVFCISFDKDSHLDDLFGNLKVEHPYSIKELGIC